METLTHDEMPNIVRLELTNTCNLQCPHCRHHSEEKRLPENYAEYYKTPVSMTEAQVAAIIDEIAPFKPSVTLNVANEPMIAPAFRYALRKIKEAGLSGTFNTNGLGLSEAIANLLVEIQYDSVTISVDAATSETLKLARGITNLDHLVKGVETLLRVRGDRPFPRVGTTFVITDYNYKELPAFLEFWKTRADFVRVTGYIKDGRPDVSYIPGWSREQLPERVPCKQIFRDIVIRANGDVTPCVITSENPDENTLGNIFRDGGVRGVWNGAAMQRLRDLHNGGKWDEIPFCGPCDYWVETFNMKEEVKDGFLVRTPSPYTTFYNVVERLGSWDKNRVHDRQGAANVREWEGSVGVVTAGEIDPAGDEVEIDS
ncbi:MAG: radical SAM protein [Elusimicrobia bacterium]|nr:radical SAM protein [Elusimicrobiota bacterium]